MRRRKRQKKSSEISASTRTAAANKPIEPNQLPPDKTLIGNSITFVTHAYICSKYRFIFKNRSSNSNLTWIYPHFKPSMIKLLC